eukprot:gene6037-10038_t
MNIGNLYWSVHPNKSFLWPCRVYRSDSKLNLYFVKYYQSDETFNDEWFWISSKGMKLYEEVKLNYFKLDTRKNIIGAMKAAEHDYKKDAPDHSFVNEDVCFKCRKGGLLMICDNCPNTFHTVCSGLPESFVPAGKWYCPKCTEIDHLENKFYPFLISNLQVLDDKHFVGDGTFYCRHQDGSIVRYNENDNNLILINEQDEDEQQIETEEQKEKKSQLYRKERTQQKETISETQQQHYKEYQKTTNRLQDPLNSILNQSYWNDNLPSYENSLFLNLKLEVLHTLKRRKEKRAISFHDEENPQKKRNTKNQDTRVTSDEYDIFQINNP